MQSKAKLFPTNSLPFLFILLIAFILRINNFNLTPAFPDEAIQLKLGNSVLGRDWQATDPFSWFSGMPQLYPQVSAFIAKYGGLTASRYFSVILGTFSVWLFYRYVKSLSLHHENDTNELIAGFSGLLFAVLSVPVFLSRLAVNDNLSFSLFLASLIILQDGINLSRPKMWHRENMFFFGFLLLFVSFLVKYVIFVYIPLQAVWTLYSCWKKGKRIYSMSVKYFLVPLAISLASYVLLNFDEIRQLRARELGMPWDNLHQVINLFVEYTAIILPLSYLGILFLIFKNFPKALFFLTGMLLIPFFHLLFGNNVNLDRHVFLSLVFAVPPIAYLISLVDNRTGILKFLTAFAIIIPVYFHSQNQLAGFESWPESEKAMAHLRENITGNEKILTQETEIASRSLPELPLANIYGLTDFQYAGIATVSGYTRALEDKYFDFVLLNDNIPAIGTDIVAGILQDRYRLIFESPPYKIFEPLN